MVTNDIPYLSLMKVCYTQPVGFGKPANLQACLPGPYGNSSYKYLLLPLSLPNFLPTAFVSTLTAGAI